MTLTKYVELARVDVLERMTHWKSTLFGASFLVIIMWVFFHIWTTIYAGDPSFKGFTLAQMLWYLAFAEMIATGSASHLIDEMSEDIKSGNIANTLLKPMSYLGGKFATHISKFLFLFVLQGVIVFLVTFALVGPIAFTPGHVLLALLLGFFGVILNTLLASMIGLLSFWMEDSTAVYWVYQKMLFVLGGMLVPLDIYPPWLQSIVQYLPFKYITYAPAKLFVHFDPAFAQTMFIGVLAWIVPSIIIVIIIYRLGLRQVNVNGG